jgi:hypothetical protein
MEPLATHQPIISERDFYIDDTGEVSSWIFTTESRSSTISSFLQRKVPCFTAISDTGKGRPFHLRHYFRTPN